MNQSRIDDRVGRKDARPMIDPNQYYWFISSMGRVEFQLLGQAVIDCMH